MPRVALSATLGNLAGAAEFLRPGDGTQVAAVSSTEPGGEIRLQVRGYVTPARPPEPDEEPGDRAAIADHLFRTLQGTDNLVFANSRAAVESHAGPTG